MSRSEALEKERSRRGRRGWDGVLVGLLGAVAVAVGVSQSDYGLSWDEPASIKYGQDILAFFKSGGSDLRATKGGPFQRGGTFHVLVEGVAAVAGGSELAVRRYITAAVGLSGMAGAALMARQIAGGFAGLMAALLLAVTPSYYGHMFINPADISFAAAHIWTLLVILGMQRRFPRLTWGNFLMFGVALGLAMGCRLGGVVMGGYYVGGWIVRWFYDRRHRTEGAWTRQVMSKLLVGSSLAGLVAIVVAIALWPAALISPLQMAMSAIQSETSFPKHEPVLFLGQYVWSDDLPWQYWVVYVLVKLPIPLLVLAFSGLFLAVPKRRGRGDVGSTMGIWLICVAWVLPLSYATALRPTDYDGMRHFLFIVPAMAVLAGIALAEAAHGLGRWWNARLEGCWTATAKGKMLNWRRFKPITWAEISFLLAFSLASTPVVGAMIALHPYQYTYYNGFVGGLRGAEGRFVTDYWALSFREAVGQLVAHARQAKHSASADHRWTVRVCGPVPVARALLPENFKVVGPEERADYYLSTTKWHCDRRVHGETIGMVQRYGVPFAVVKWIERNRKRSSEKIRRGARGLGGVGAHVRLPWAVSAPMSVFLSLPACRMTLPS